MSGGVQTYHSFLNAQGVKQGCLLSPLIFSLLISGVAEYVRKKKWKSWNSITTKPRRDIPFIIRRRYCPRSSTPSGLQNQINNLEKASNSLGLTVNLDKTKVMIFRKGGHIGGGFFINIF